MHDGRRAQPPRLEHRAEHHVSHPEPKGREIHSAESLEQIVISSAATNRAKFALRVEQLEHDACVVCEPADDRQVEPRPLRDVEPP
jgi:hypothetical protein